MSLQDKYRPVLDLGVEYDAKDGYVEELDGKLRIGGKVETQFQKDKMLDTIAAIGGENPPDLEAKIEVSNTAYYHKHVVTKGDSLSKIAKYYYQDPMKYMKIFKANADVLKDPNLIYPDQELIIPFPDDV